MWSQMCNLFNFQTLSVWFSLNSLKIKLWSLCDLCECVTVWPWQPMAKLIPNISFRSIICPIGSRQKSPLPHELHQKADEYSGWPINTYSQTFQLYRIFVHYKIDMCIGGSRPCQSLNSLKTWLWSLRDCESVWLCVTVSYVIPDLMTYDVMSSLAPDWLWTQPTTLTTHPRG